MKKEFEVCATVARTFGSGRTFFPIPTSGRSGVHPHSPDAVSRGLLQGPRLSTRDSGCTPLQGSCSGLQVREDCHYGCYWLECMRTHAGMRVVTDDVQVSELLALARVCKGVMLAFAPCTC